MKAVLVMSDVHYGKKTRSFNCDVLERRMEKLGEKLKGVRDAVGYDVDEFVVVNLGDNSDGSGIYPTQGHHQDETDVLMQTDPVADMFVELTERVRDDWKVKVRWECVAGNHGRTGRFAHESTNWDVLVYRSMARSLREREGVEVNFGDSGQDTLFLRRFKVGDVWCLGYHGQSIRMYATIPRYGIVRRLEKWATSRKLQRFRYAFFGHFHTCEYFAVNDRECFLTGTMVSDDPWALETLGCESSTNWWLLFVKEDGGLEEQRLMRLT